VTIFLRALAISPESDEPIELYDSREQQRRDNRWVTLALNPPYEAPPSPASIRLRSTDSASGAGGRGVGGVGRGGF
jgi:hypothetical protein